MPSGPVDVNATSPVPGAEFQPSGSGTVIVGATGSGTDALVMRLSLERSGGPGRPGRSEPVPVTGRPAGRGAR